MALIIMVAIFTTNVMKILPNPGAINYVIFLQLHPANISIQGVSASDNSRTNYFARESHILGTLSSGHMINIETSEHMKR